MAESEDKPLALRSEEQTATLDAVPTVDVDDDGKFKYVLMEVRDGERWKHIVRGCSFAEYHSDVVDRTRPGVRALGLELFIKGGGRIEHVPHDERLYVYGYSMAYGQARHAITTALLKEAYPAYRDVSWSNEGY